MSRILPFKSEVEATPDKPRVVNLDGDEAEAVFNALSSDTSREIYRKLYDEPATASEVAKFVDTSVQNARYHLDKLKEAGLIDQVDTWYSSRGNEMAVYAATSGALIVSGGRYEQSELRSVFETILSSIALLAMFSVIAHYAVLEFFTEGVSPPDDDAGVMTSEEIPQDQNVVDPYDTEHFMTEVTPTPGGSSVEQFIAEVMTLPPGLLVFLGGLVVLVIAGSVYTIRRP